MVKPGVMRRGILEWERSNQAQQVGILAGAIAEELCEHYSDTIDPSDCARAAMAAYTKVMAMDKVQFQLGDEAPRAADAGVAKH
jgi:hypothetical protein